MVKTILIQWGKVVGRTCNAEVIAPNYVSISSRNQLLTIAKAHLIPSGKVIEGSSFHEHSLPVTYCRLELLLSFMAYFDKHKIKLENANVIHIKMCSVG